MPWTTCVWNLRLRVGSPSCIDVCLHVIRVMHSQVIRPHVFGTCGHQGACTYVCMSCEYASTSHVVLTCVWNLQSADLIMYANHACWPHCGWSVIACFSEIYTRPNLLKRLLKLIILRVHPPCTGGMVQIYLDFTSAWCPTRFWCVDFLCIPLFLFCRPIERFILRLMENLNYCLIMPWDINA